ncbi:MAG TPA: GNAT family N-acetyltransferase [Candidatus Bathyarchaeia archaeon]|nr:GNAT family N-acetyltransferase [Candidatus Bathyarchaeia archaeon]
MKIVPLESDPSKALDYLNERSLQVGRLLPIGDGLLGEFFASGSSYVLLRGRVVNALFSYNAGREKQAPTARFRVVTDSVSGLRDATRLVERAAVAGEKIVLRTNVFGYDKKRLQALKALGFSVGASLPGVVSLDGRRFDYHLLYKELGSRYKPIVRRNYAKPGLYKAVEVEKAKTPKLRIRGYRSEDRPILDKFTVHHNVMRGIGSGVFEGLYPFTPGDYQQRVAAKQVFPIVCEDEVIGEPVGSVDLFGSPAQVMQHSMGTGIFVRPDYQGLGVGTMLMEASKTLAMRLHLGRVWLSVFDGNSPAQALYRKAGFEESGRLPGWLQEGYVDEIFMTLKLE